MNGPAYPLPRCLVFIPRRSPSTIEDSKRPANLHEPVAVYRAGDRYDPLYRQYLFTIFASELKNPQTDVTITAILDGLVCAGQSAPGRVRLLNERILDSIDTARHLLCAGMQVRRA